MSRFSVDVFQNRVADHIVRGPREGWNVYYHCGRVTPTFWHDITVIVITTSGRLASLSIGGGGDDNGDVFLTEVEAVSIFRAAGGEYSYAL